MKTEIALETESIKQKCRQIIDGFVHRDALREDDIRTWIREVVAAHGEAAIWHAARAGGFGGSDIGVLVRNFGGHRADHQNSAHDIVAAKLLKSAPVEGTGDLQRGHDNEPLHAQRYYQKYGAQRDTSAFAQLGAAKGVRVWMRYSPDDVVLVPATRENPALGGARAKRLLIDYKAPRTVDPSDQIAFQYTCQLYQGAMICAKAHIHLDGLMLSQFDWAQWSLKDDVVAYDPNLARLILQAGDYYHGFVLRGELPAYVVKPRFDREAEFVQSIGYLAQRYAHVSALAKAFETEAEYISQRIKAAIGDDVRLANTKMRIGDLDISAVTSVDHARVNKLLRADEIAGLRKKNGERSYDAEAMADALRILGGDPEQYRVDKVDAEKAYQHLLSRGEDPDSFMSEQIRFKVSDRLKEAARDVVQSTFPRESDTGEFEDNQARMPFEQAGQGLLQTVREGQFTERHSQRTTMV